MAKAVHKRHECIGCMACLSCEGWEMKGDKPVMSGVKYKKGKNNGKETDLGIKEECTDSDRQAAEICPVNCISIE